MRFKILLGVLSMTAVLCFTACSAQNRSDSSAGTAVPTESAPEKTTPAENASAENNPTAAAQEESTPAQPEPAQQEKSAANTPDLSVLSAGIQDLEQRIGNITPAGSVQEQKEQYLALKSEIDALDNELDYTEDALESQYRGGSLEITQYQEQEREIDALEDRLDHCEDQLEFIFGIDD